MRKHVILSGGRSGGKTIKLIAKQQLEIEELKAHLSEYKRGCDDARNCLYHPEQWSMKCPDFPKVAMHGILTARDALEGMGHSSD